MAVKALCTLGRAGPLVGLMASGDDRARTWATPRLALYSIRMSISTGLPSPFQNSQTAGHQKHTASCPSLLSPSICELRVEGPGPDSLPSLSPSSQHYVLSAQK
ncbi:hypothetical protein D623_10029599 [Myotis brandtii]|uniref:Uncharacterized protein n=1 Tax=Myotis brandtii TaxID=109478 RepID=S7PQS8_MYOBR|nr:hypothetical protein D623_10029599 [Myotis brandtii]